MYTMLNNGVNIQSPMHIVDVEKKIVYNDETECIICYEMSYGDNLLLKGSEIFDSACSCNYMVHTGCIQTWLETKNQHFCLCCNSVVTIKPLEPIRSSSIMDDISAICCNVLLITVMCVLTISFIVVL